MTATAVWGLTNRDSWLSAKKGSKAPVIETVVVSPISLPIPITLPPPLEELEPEPWAREEPIRAESILKVAIKNDSSYMRMAMLKTLRDTCPAIWQQHMVPLDICERILAPIPHSDETLYVVLFSTEFVETLVRTKGVDPQQVLFFADHDLVQNAAGKLYDVQASSWRLSQDFLCKPDFQTDAFLDLLEEDINTMKFKKLVVVGNPPYQKETAGTENGKQATPLYNLFVEAILDYLQPDYLSLIVPSRWMVGGMGLDKHRERMTKDKHLKSITHFPDASEVFPTVEIKGGVNYFLWDKKYNGPCSYTVGKTTTIRNLDEYDIVIQDINALPIVEKVRENCSAWMSERVMSLSPFGLPTNFSDWKEAGVPCCSRGKKMYFCAPDAFTDKNGILDKWKVCVSEAGDGGVSGERSIFPYVLVLPPGTICTFSYAVTGVFNTEEEALSCVSYLKTKFFRFMLGLRVLTQHVNKDKFAWVPDVDDYTKEWTDRELYGMFGLNDEEQAYIEGKIKPLS